MSVISEAIAADPTNPMFRFPPDCPPFKKSATSTEPARNVPFPLTDKRVETPLESAERAAKIARWAFADAERAEFRTKCNHVEAEEVLRLATNTLASKDAELRRLRAEANQHAP